MRYDCDALRGTQSATRGIRGPSRGMAVGIGSATAATGQRTVLAAGSRQSTATAPMACLGEQATNECRDRRHQQVYPPRRPVWRRCVGQEQRSEIRTGKNPTPPRAPQKQRVPTQKRVLTLFPPGTQTRRRANSRIRPNAFGTWWRLPRQCLHALLSQSNRRPLQFMDLLQFIHRFVQARLRTPGQPCTIRGTWRPARYRRAGSRK